MIGLLSTSGDGKPIFYGNCMFLSDLDKFLDKPKVTVNQ